MIVARLFLLVKEAVSSLEWLVRGIHKTLWPSETYANTKVPEIIIPWLCQHFKSTWEKLTSPSLSDSDSDPISDHQLRF